MNSLNELIGRKIQVGLEHEGQQTLFPGIITAVSIDEFHFNEKFMEPIYIGRCYSNR